MDFEEIKKPEKKSIYKRILTVVSILIYLIALAIVIGLVYMKIILPELTPISVETVKDSVVMINTYDENNQELGQGSGFSFKESNIIITNFHVLEGAEKIKITTDDGKEYDINEILIFDKINDLALIKGDFKLKPVAYVSAYKISGKDKITTISSPGGAFNTISVGTVSEVYKDQTEILAPIKPGSSGGAVLNQKGRVFAVIVANLNPDTDENLAVNIDLAESLFNKYTNDKYATIENKAADIQGFLPDIFDDKDGSELTITDKWTKNKVQLYHPDSLVTFNHLTSGYSIFTQAMIDKNDEFAKIYSELSPKKKILVVDYYQYLKAYDQWWFSKDNNEFDETKNLRKDNIKEWSDEQLLIDLGVMERNQLAILGAITEDLIYYEDFAAVVKKLPIEEGRKTILLLTFGGSKPSRLSSRQNISVRDFLNKNLSKDKGKINEVLKRLGY